MKPLSQIRIMVIEPNLALRDGVVALIGREHDMQVAGACSGSENAVEDFRRLKPHVVIVDVSVHGAIDLMSQFRHERPQTNVIALINYEWDADADAAARASGSSCLPKFLISERLITLIRQTYPV